MCSDRHGAERFLGMDKELKQQKSVPAEINATSSHLQAKRKTGRWMKIFYYGENVFYVSVKVVQSHTRQ